MTQRGQFHLFASAPPKKKHNQCIYLCIAYSLIDSFNVQVSIYSFIIHAFISTIYVYIMCVSV